MIVTQNQIKYYNIWYQIGIGHRNTSSMWNRDSYI